MGKLSTTFLLLSISSSLLGDYFIRNPIIDVTPSYNSVGQTGLIHIPSAEFNEAGSLGITIGNSSTNKFISVIASPFNWLETSFYYQRPRDTIYRNLKRGNNLDKGFNIKVGKSFKGIDVALGLDDIAGTGLLSKEYIVATLHGSKI